MKPYRKITISAKSKGFVDELSLPNQVSGPILRSDGRYDIELSDGSLQRLQKIDADVDVAIENLARRIRGGGIQ